MDDANMNNVETTRDIIQDSATIMSLSDEEKDLASDIITEIDKREEKPTDQAVIKEVLSDIRQLRENRASEEKFRSTYTSSKSIEAIFDDVRSYRDQKSATAEKIDSIRNNDRYSESYKSELINQENAALSDRTFASKEATLALLDDITADRLAYDKAFFSDSERLAKANSVISVLKNAGKNISIEDFANLTEPLYGDAAANRYVWAAIKDEPIMLKDVIEDMAVDTRNAFDDSRRIIDAYYRGQFDATAHGVMLTLKRDAEKVGISLNIPDYDEPEYSSNRNKTLEADFSEKEAYELIRRSMRGY